MSVQRQKGTSFESLLVPLLKEYYPDASRRPLQGVNDMGDLLLPGEHRFIISAKNHREMRLAEWVDEATDRLALNFEPSGNAVGVVVHKRRGAGLAYDQYATMRFGDFLWVVNRTDNGR